MYIGFNQHSWFLPNNEIESQLKDSNIFILYRPKWNNKSNSILTSVVLENKIGIVRIAVKPGHFDDEFFWPYQEYELRIHNFLPIVQFTWSQVVDVIQHYVNPVGIRNVLIPYFLNFLKIACNDPPHEFEDEKEIQHIQSNDPVIKRKGLLKNFWSEYHKSILHLDFMQFYSINWGMDERFLILLIAIFQIII